MTLLNWTGEPLPSLEVEIRGQSSAARVESVRRGPLKFQREGDRIRFTLPLDSVDIVALRP